MWTSFVSNSFERNILESEASETQENEHVTNNQATQTSSQTWRTLADNMNNFFKGIVPARNQNRNMEESMDNDSNGEVKAQKRPGLDDVKEKLNTVMAHRYFKPGVALFGVIFMIGIGILIYELVRVPTYSCPAAGEASIKVESRKIRLQPSESGQVCVLESSSSQETVLLGRSYDGYDWEQAIVSPEQFKCESDGSCLVTVPSSKGTFYLKTYESSESQESQPTEKEIARFLLQATFGPTRDEIANWGTKSIRDWIIDQLQLNASLHRAYFRKRANPRTNMQTLPGRSRKPCENLSRWHRWAFTEKDIGKEIVISGTGEFVTLSVDGIDRTVVNSSEWNPDIAAAPFIICEVEETVGGEVEIGQDCSQTVFNPGINLSSVASDRLITLGPAELVELAAPIDGVKVLQLSGDVLPTCNIVGFGPIFVSDPVDTLLYQHDARLVMLDNTVEAPADNVEATDPYCPNVPMTFLNIEGCVVGGQMCSSTLYTSAAITLTDSTIREFFTEGGVYVYRIDDLRLDNEDSPCETSTSRLVKRSDTPCGAGASNDDIEAGTTALLVGLLDGAAGSNPLIRDITLPSDVECNPTNTKGARLDITDGSCWEHVHPDLHNVYDFGYWSTEDAHPGNEVALSNGRQNPIKKHAETDGVIMLSFPSNHPMSRWDDNKFRFPFLGRYLDQVDFANLPATVQTSETANHFGSAPDLAASQDEYVLRCGSPGEVANDPSFGARFGIGLYDDDNIRDRGPGTLDYRLNHENFKTATWTMNALFAEDQLRQRLAFALSQILVVTEQQVSSDETEVFLAYYDIFVRNAFGNYRDVLKEVSYSPLMADMLTFLRTKSFQYSLDTQGREIFPDENYAREIMQLFSIGLVRLNNDGTIMYDKNGVPLETYTNEDIIAFSRAWTGFERQSSRGNFESIDDTSTTNRIDPMRIVPEWRDVFPKMDLFGGYIGDRYPLCTDLPGRMFLRKGALYRYLGVSPLPELLNDPGSFDLDNDEIRRVSLEVSSALYNALCDPDITNGNKCRHKSQVKIETNMVCTGIECDVDTVRVVNVSNAFYEYVRPACVELPFYEDGLKISKRNTREAMCADPKSIVASEACCNSDSTSATQTCVYHGERMTYNTASQRCQAQSKETCDFRSSVNTECWNGAYHWSSGECDVQVKVNNEGKVAIVHNPSLGPSGENTIIYMREHVDAFNKNWFRVTWRDDNFPAASDNCMDGLCEVFQENSCMCNTSMKVEPVFTSVPSSADEVISKLHIGSISPEVYDSGLYSLSESSNAEVKAYIHASENGIGELTIFEVLLHGKQTFLRNVLSTVSLGEKISFRNPPTLMSLVEGTTLDAMYETDAVIDHFFYHPNCPPFIAYRLIQRFVTSNPSPRYIDVVATAFSEGLYDGIGSGDYGDLSATIAAVLLDREARSTVLDMDPAHGQLREPLLKVIHFLRSMELYPKGNREVELDDLEFTIGEMAHLAPDVFSFFKPEYSPPGPAAEAGLTAPEAQILTSPKAIAYLNGMISAARFGLSDCYDGFANLYESRNCYRLSRNWDDPTLFSAGNLLWSPDEGMSAMPSKIIDELDLLLTAGRLDEDVRDLILEEYLLEQEENGNASAIRAAQQLFVASPEFQTTNYVQRQDGAVRETIQERNGTKPFKAIVYLFLFGGCDSHNLFIPHSNCEDKDMFQEYVQVRTDIALEKSELLQINVPPGEQVCETFGIHPNLPRVKQLYDDGDTLFLANVGVMIEPVNKEEYEARSKSLPESLFAHNTQQQSTQTMRPQTFAADGVIGRMNDALWDSDFSIGAFSISGKNFVLEGQPGRSPAQDFINGGGVQELNPSAYTDRINVAIENMTKSVSSSIYGETWCSSLQGAIDRSEKLKEVLDNTELEQPFAATGGLANQFRQVAKLIKARDELGYERGTFFVDIGGFDTHSNVGSVLVNKFTEIDAVIASFEEEMKLQGLWDDVVIVQASEFARTITSNGAGTDHGWGGNYMLVGGGVRGGHILGTYPDDLTSEGPLNIGRGRFIPTTSWDEVWYGIATWFGVPEDQVEYVLPNLKRFPESSWFDQNTLFGTENAPQPGELDLGLVLGLTLTTAVLGALVAVFVKTRHQEGKPIIPKVGTPQSSLPSAVKLSFPIPKPKTGKPDQVYDLVFKYL